MEDQELQELITSVNLRPVDIQKESNGTISLNQASQWLRFDTNKRALSKSARLLLQVLAQAKQRTLDKDVKVPGLADRVRQEILDKAVLCLPVAEQPVVYFLIHRGELVYIGQSINGGPSRWETHRKTFDFDQVHTIATPRCKLDEMEQYYIKLLAPVHNKKHNPNWSPPKRPCKPREDKVKREKEVDPLVQADQGKIFTMSKTWDGLPVAKQAYPATTPKNGQYINVGQISIFSCEGLFYVGSTCKGTIFGFQHKGDKMVAVLEEEKESGFVHFYSWN